ncbi:hypothetical protein IWQ60_010244 [Tieghemiomyces parasiticus]|uniref:Glutaredoxin-like protein n=1 Tax=Tieghemiomyces parasiticus TaxID=78921 RepID=A0A9W8DIP5_9FUNG|nr:hypothetical protein IWQ60_010244 [Tieghemiomyces parasiticus]
MSAGRRLLTLFTSNSCSLCAEAKQALLTVRKQVPFDLKEVDIHTPENRKECEKYTFDIPVLHIDHKYAMKHRINQEKLLSLLRQGPQ